MQNSTISDLQLSYDTFKEVCDISSEAILILDASDYSIKFANQKVARILDYELPELLEKVIFDLHPESEKSNIQDILKNVAESQKANFHLGNFCNKSGESQAVRIQISLSQNKNYFICVGKPCTTSAQEFKEHFDACPELKNRMLQMEKMATVGTLVAGVAHEINTPIGALNSNNDTINRFLPKILTKLKNQENLLPATLDQELRQAIGSISKLVGVSKTALERIIHIIQSLRKLVRQDQEMVDTDLNLGLESTLTLVAHYLRGVIEVHKDFGEIPKLKCFPSQLNQVFLNLLVNAIQAIDQKGEIFVKTEFKDETILVEIRDTGIGIPDKNLKQIYNPGYTTKTSEKGTGLGLSIVKDIIESHNGTIQVSSKPGIGTKFQIFLPL